MPPSRTDHWIPVRMAELLAAVTAEDTVDGALTAVVDGVAETFDAEITLLLRGEEVAASLGLGGTPPPASLLHAREGVQEIPGVGACQVRSVRLEDSDLDRIMIARTGAPFTDVETALLTGTARTIELSLRNVRSLARERDLREAAAEQAARNAELVADLRDRAAFDDTLLDIAKTLLVAEPAHAETSVRTAVEEFARFLDLTEVRISLDPAEPEWLRWEAPRRTPQGTVQGTVMTLELPSRAYPKGEMTLLPGGGDSVGDEQAALMTVVADLIANALDRESTHRALADANEELRRTNRALEQTNDELRRANELKDEFVSMTSHELRTPLTAIRGFAETLVELGDGLTDRVRDQLAHRILRQADTLTRLVGDILDVSRFESGKIEVETERVDLEEAVHAMLGEAWPGLDDVRVAGCDAAVWVDPEHLRRMLLNLVENARKYGAPPIEITAASESDGVRISVVDAGEGVPESFRPQLFEKFHQASRGTRRSSTGTGLGLAIVRQLAVLNGGEVGYDDAPDGGAHFWIVLPGGDGEHPGGSRTSGPSAGGRASPGEEPSGP